MAYARFSNDPFMLQWAYEDIKVYEAWDQETGSRDVVVAVIDTGVDTFHPDLKANMWRNVDEIPGNALDDDLNGYVDDVYGWDFVEEDMNGDGMIDQQEAQGNNDPRPQPLDGTGDGAIHHGTLVAGIIGAIGNNNLDGVGINWRVRIMNIRMLANDGYGDFDSMDRAIRYAVDNGADMINLSFVGNPDIDITGSIEYAYDNDVAIFAAAGNNSTNLNTHPLYPVCSDAGSDTQKIIGVSAIDEEHHLTGFSNRGSDCIDIAAPGVGLWSAVRFSPIHDLLERYSGDWDGTSFAAPLVTGAAALVQSVQPQWGPDEIYEALLTTVQHTPGQDEEVYANLFGAGLLQVDGAVQYALDRHVGPTREALDSIIAFDTQRATQYKHNPDTGRGGIIEDKPFVVGADDVVSFIGEDDLRYFVVARRGNTWRRYITIYTESGQEVRTWHVPTREPLQLATGDVYGDSEVDIVVAGLYSDSYHTGYGYRVYSQDGSMLSRHYVGPAERLSVDTAQDLEREKEYIVMLYKVGDQVIIGAFPGDGKPPIAVHGVEDLLVPGDVAAVDFDGDGTDEYALSSGFGQPSKIVYLNSDGSLRRSFGGYPGSFQQGISLAGLDYDRDGREDVIIWDRAGNQPVRIWNYRSQLLSEWVSFEEVEKQQLTIVPLYR